MQFFKTAPLLIAVLATTSVMAGNSPHQEESGRKLDPHSIRAQMEALGMAPIGNDVVRIGQNGEPVTRLQDQSIKMAKELANAILAEEEAARARGEKVPERKKRDLWAEREQEIAERRAKYGFEPTKHFTIPGTTPEISARIFGPNSRVSKDAEGNTVYETPEEIVTVSKNGVAKVVPRQQLTIRVGSVSKRIDAPQADQAKPEDKDVQTAHGSLDGVEKGFSDVDMKDAAEMLKRGAQGIRVEGYFEDMPKDDCSACTNPATKKGPSVSTSDYWDKVFRELFGIKSANANPVMNINEIAKAGQKILEEAAASEDPLVAKNAQEEWGQAQAIQLVNDLAQTGRLNPKLEDIRGFDDNVDAQLRKMAQEEAKNPSARDTYIFISYSLGDKALLDILEAASGKDNVELVMRGVPEDSNIVEGMARIRELASKFDPLPNVIIDSGLFKAYGVKTVPTVVRVSEKRMMRPKPKLIDAIRDELGLTEEERRNDDIRGEVSQAEADPSYTGRTVPMMIAKVEGLNNARWLNEQIELGHIGDFGNRGYIYPIHEPDIIEVLQKRALGIDWEAKKQAALDNFWKGQEKNFFALSTAKQSCSRVLDPTFEVAQTIQDTEGRVIRAAGELVNPLDHNVFNMAVVVFNPTNKEEIETVKKLKERFAADKTAQQVVWIASEFDVDRGWDAYTELTDLLDAPLYLLSPEIIDRWNLTVTPSVITANNAQKHFIIEEIAPGDEQNSRSCNEHVEHN